MINETLGLYLPDCVLDFTEGKRGVICGGGNNEKDRVKLEKILCFKSLEWVETKEYQMGPYQAAAKRIGMGAYDVLFCVIKWISHSGLNVLVPAAKGQSVPIIRIQAGISANVFSKAIEEQVCRGLSLQAAANSSSQVVASMGRPVSY